jgi:hypothetical protein
MTIQQKAALNVTMAVAETIKEIGSTPAGPLYAALMGKGCDLSTFNAIIGVLCRTGLVRRSGDMINWVGAEPVAAAG